MTVEKLTDTQTRIGFKNGDILTLIGTAHISSTSAEEVKKTIDEISPDSICIELDSDRWNKIINKEDSSSINVVNIIKNGKTFFTIVSLILSSFQKKLKLDKDKIVGEEIVSAGLIAKEKNINMTLADRNIATTLKRAWRLSKFSTKTKLLSTLLSTLFDKTEITEEQLDELKKTSNIEVMLSDIAKELPEVKETLIDERDLYLSSKIYNAQGKNKIAVVGAGHCSGIIKNLERLDNGENIDIQKLDFVPEKSKTSKVLSWIVPILLLGCFVSIGIVKGIDKGFYTFGLWAVVNAVSCFVFSLLSLSHPLTALVGAICSPITSLSPVIGVGMVTGIVEAHLKKPRISDIETITDDASTFKGWFKNRALHVFTVFLISSLGTSLGTFLFFPIVAGILG